MLADRSISYPETPRPVAVDGLSPLRAEGRHSAQAGAEMIRD
jgi:hypothetical protein